jgi:hypothetical protein
MVAQMPDLQPGHVWVTRRRWDWFFLPGIALSLIVWAWVSWYPGTDRWWAGLLFVDCLVVFWLMFRLSCPQRGEQVVTISGQPGTVPLLRWVIGWSAVAMVGNVLYSVWFHYPQDNEELLQFPGLLLVGGMAAWFVVLLTGNHLIERRAKRHPPSRTPESSTTPPRI